MVPNVTASTGPMIGLTNIDLLQVGEKASELMRVAKKISDTYHVDSYANTVTDEFVARPVAAIAAAQATKSTGISRREGGRAVETNRKEQQVSYMVKTFPW
jgi:hypothetical protein